MYLRMYSWNVLGVFHEAIHSPFTGYHLGHSSGLGTVGPVEMKKLSCCSQKTYKVVKIGVGLENWGIRREEPLLNAPVKEGAVATAQGSVPIQSYLKQTLCCVGFPGLSWRPEKH